MKTLLYVFLTAVFTVGLTFASYIFFDIYTSQKELSQVSTSTPTPIQKSLLSYSIENLSKRTPTNSEIVLLDPIATTSSYLKHPFYYYSDGKKVTGLATIPIRNRLSPVVIQFRGYVDRDQYKPGIGTSKSAEVLAQNGYVSLAPDFLGYGGSDMPSTDIFEERFQTYTVALDLVAALPSLPMIDSEKIGLWGHSNGGHIALTVLGILNKPIPTVLWAPVTKHFPYSILYFTDEAPDGGKALRKKLAEFETNHDTAQFTIANYHDRLVGPIQLHQGTADDAVPSRWSDEFVQQTKKEGIEIQYFTYPGADHNMVGSWELVMQRTIQFFQRSLQD